MFRDNNTRRSTLSETTSWKYCKDFGCFVFFSGYNQKHCKIHEKSDLEIQQSVSGRKLSKIHFSVFQISIALTLHLAPILVFFSTATKIHNSHLKNLQNCSKTILFVFNKRSARTAIPALTQQRFLTTNNSQRDKKIKTDTLRPKTFYQSYQNVS